MQSIKIAAALVSVVLGLPVRQQGFRSLIEVSTVVPACFTV